MAVMAVVSAGCADERVVGSLADVGGDLWVHIRFEPRALVATVGGDLKCFVLDRGFTGHIDGAARPLVYPGSDIGPDLTCHSPSLTFEAVPMVAPSTLVVSDETRTVTIDLGAWLLPRTATLRSPADRLIRPGTEMVFDWTPSTDLTADPSHTRFVVAEHSDVTGWLHTVPVVRREDQLVAIAPDEPSKIPPGPGDVRVWMEVRGPLPLPCSGATCLLLQHDTRSEIDVTFAPSRAATRAAKPTAGSPSSSAP